MGAHDALQDSQYSAVCALRIAVACGRCFCKGASMSEVSKMTISSDPRRLLSV